MARGVNKVILIGNLGNDPETKSMPSGNAVTNITVATSESWKDKQTGQQQERTEWHRVVIFDEKLCEIATKYLQKGSKVYVEGQLQTRKWTDQSGDDRYSTEVVLRRFNGSMQMLDARGEGGDQAGEDSYGGDAPARRAASGGGAGAGFDDDIPF